MSLEDDYKEFLEFKKIKSDISKQAEEPKPEPKKEEAEETKTTTMDNDGHLPEKPKHILEIGEDGRLFCTDCNEKFVEASHGTKPLIQALNAMHKDHDVENCPSCRAGLNLPEQKIQPKQSNEDKMAPGRL